MDPLSRNRSLAPPTLFTRKPPAGPLGSLLCKALAFISVHSRFTPLSAREALHEHQRPSVVQIIAPRAPQALHSPTRAPQAVPHRYAQRLRQTTAGQSLKAM